MFYISLSPHYKFSSVENWPDRQKNTKNAKTKILPFFFIVQYLYMLYYCSLFLIFWFGGRWWIAIRYGWAARCGIGISGHFGDISAGNWCWRAAANIWTIGCQWLHIVIGCRCAAITVSAAIATCASIATTTSTGSNTTTTTFTHFQLF